MTTPIYARKAPDNTVNVLDGKFNEQGKFTLFVEDSAAGALLQDLLDNAISEATKNYSYTFDWTAGKLTSITRTVGGTSEQATLSYDLNDNLASISAWQGGV